MGRYKDEFEYDFLSDDNRRLAVTESDYNSLVDNNMYTVTSDILPDETVAAEETEVSDSFLRNEFSKEQYSDETSEPIIADAVEEIPKADNSTAAPTEINTSAARELLYGLCDNFYNNQEIIKNNLSWTSCEIVAASVLMFLENTIVEDKERNINVKAELADIEKLICCRDIVKTNTKMFSNFRKLANIPLICQLYKSAEPEVCFNSIRYVYKELNKYFSATELLPLVAMCIVSLAEPKQYDEIINRSFCIHEMMVKKHPLITTPEDSLAAALHAFSDKTNEELIKDMEDCYKLLSKKFMIGDVTQSLSHILALGEASADDKCEKLFELYDGLSNRECKYKKNFGLVLLGVLSLLPTPVQIIIDDIIEAEDSLYFKYGQDGPNKSVRLVHAAMIVACAYSNANSFVISCIAAHGVIASINKRHNSIVDFDVSDIVEIFSIFD